MSDSIVLTGVVATVPRSITTAEGLAITSFRLASTQRRFDRASGAWVDGETNWYSVAAFRRLAENTAQSLSKGDRVLVSGRVKVRDWQNAGRSGTTVEVEAEGIGHDLSWGCSHFVKRGGASSSTGAGSAGVPIGSEVDGAPGSTSGGGSPSELATVDSDVSGQWAIPAAVPF